MKRHIMATTCMVDETILAHKTEKGKAFKGDKCRSRQSVGQA